MNDSQHHGRWRVEPRVGSIRMKTDRIGMFTIDAHAPILGGTADWAAKNATLTFEVAISEVKTGNLLLDPEVHALVHKGSDGVLTFAGKGAVTGDAIRFEGTARAGDVEVPLTITGEAAENDATGRDVTISGTATFDDIHIPIPGFTHLQQISIYITGDLRLTR